MANLKLSHKVSFKLAITPQLKQALRILQLPHAALKEYLIKQISENPLLQSPDGESLNVKIRNILNSRRDDFRFDQPSPAETTDAQFTEKQSGPTLQEYLFHQLRMSFLNEQDLTIAQELIDNIDNNGYLRISIDKLVKEHNISLDKAKRVLQTIQAFDPPGVGARDLQECLLIQLKNKQQEQSLAYKITYSYFKELSRKKYALIAKRLNTDIHKVKEAIKKITALNPKPGIVFSKDKTIAVVPDITVRIRKNKLHVDLNKAYLPKLNPEYTKLLSDPATAEETRQFINKRLRSALWLIQAIEQKQKNTLKVTRVALSIQKQALSRGLSHLKPLAMKDIASKTGLHISTVSRIISNKYIDTPQGTIRAKDLFSPGLTLENNGTISQKSTLNKIKKIIIHEHKEKPLTDRMISAMLRKNGIRVSRRTIVKYRNLLKIPPSYLR